MKKLKRHLETFHCEEKNYCEKHKTRMIRIPCTMYVYCLQCVEEKEKMEE